MFGFFVLFRRFIFFQDFLRRFRRFCHFTKSFYGSLKQIYQCKKQSNCMLFWALAVYTAQTLSNWYSGSIFGDYCLLLLFLFLSFFLRYCSFTLWLHTFHGHGISNCCCYCSWWCYSKTVLFADKTFRCWLIFHTHSNTHTPAFPKQYFCHANNASCNNGSVR